MSLKELIETVERGEEVKVSPGTWNAIQGMLEFWPSRVEWRIVLERGTVTISKPRREGEE